MTLVHLSYALFPDIKGATCGRFCFCADYNDTDDIMGSKNAFDNENPSVVVSVFILIAMWGQQFRSSHIPASMFVDKPMFARLVWSGLPGQTDASAL